MLDNAQRTHVCMGNMTNVVGGVETVIENYMSGLDPGRYQLSYLYSPFEGDQEHRNNILASRAQVVTMRAVLPNTDAPPEKPKPTAEQQAIRLWKRVQPGLEVAQSTKIPFPSSRQ